MLYLFKQIKKNTWRYHYFTPEYQKSWYDLQFLKYSVWQTEIGNYGSFFALLTQYWPRKSKFGKNVKIAWIYYPFTHDDHMMYGFWDMRRDGHNFWTEFCHFGPFFVLWPSKQPKKSKIKILKKTPRDIIILHFCTTNYYHMMYGSWDIKRDRENFLWFWAIFALLPN